MKKCELCGEGARMYCESDQASLCWDCDEKVHCANFLVAKHTRCLLCHACQSLTPWKASGPKLGHTVSVCDACVSLHSNNTQQHQQQQQVDNQSQEANSHDYDQDDDAESSESFKDGDEDEEDEEEEDEEDYVDDEDDAENQVVPWSGNSTSSPPPPVLSSSSSMSSSEELFSRGVVLNKRIRNNPDLLYSDDEMGCSSSQVAGDDVTYFRPLKQKRTTEPNRSAGGGQDHAETESTSTAAITSLKRLQKQIIADGEGASTVILGICNPSRDQSR